MASLASRRRGTAVHLADPYRVWPLCGTVLGGADRARLTRELAEVTCRRCRRAYDAQDLREVRR